MLVAVSLMKTEDRGTLSASAAIMVIFVWRPWPISVPPFQGMWISEVILVVGRVAYREQRGRSHRGRCVREHRLG